MPLYDDTGAFDLYGSAVAPGSRQTIFDTPNGALYQNPVGILDPRSAMILGLAQGMLKASGPSPYPVSFGQVAGAGVEGAMTQGMRAQQIAQQNAFQQARMGLVSEQMRKLQADRALQESLASSGALGNMNDPDKLEALGTRLAAGGHAGGASLIEQAQRIRKRREEEATARTFRSAPGVLGAGVTTNTPQGQALMSNLTGDTEFDSAVLAAQNEALNANARPTMPAQAVQAPRPGLMGPLMTSPYVGPAARQLQGQLDQAPSLNPQQWLNEYNQLQQQHMTATNQAAARADNQSFRQGLADQNAELRRDLFSLSARERAARQRERADDRQDQRTFTQERAIAQDYNNEPTVKGFKALKPQFTAAAQYLAEGKFNSSGDQALVYQFVKMNDPNDRVARGDLTDINKLGNIPERFRQFVVSAATGKELPERVRLEMFGEMRRKWDTANELQQQLEDEYEARAKRYMVRPENVVIRHAIRGNDGWTARPK